jgi:hypothetical protein
MMPSWNFARLFGAMGSICWQSQSTCRPFRHAFINCSLSAPASKRPSHAVSLSHISRAQHSTRSFSTMSAAMMTCSSSMAVRPALSRSSRNVVSRRSSAITIARAAPDDSAAPAPSVSAPSIDAPAVKNTLAKKMAKKAAKDAKAPPPLQKPKRRKAKTGEKKVEVGAVKKLISTCIGP